MQSHYIKYKEQRIHYLQMGEGKDVVICFHGYGESAVHFAYLERYLGKEKKLYCIDLPFHGQTPWQEGIDFLPEDLLTIISQIVGPQSYFSLLGYSMGGRIALSLYTYFPQRINKLVLLAPDGLVQNFWYGFATQTWIGNRLFRYTMKHPQWFFLLLKVGNRLGLINASIFKFVNYYINDKEARMILYHRWHTLRKFKPTKAQIKKLIRAHKTPIHLIFGEFDRIIQPSLGKQFIKGIEDYTTITVLKAGHILLQEKYADDILKAVTETC